MAGVALVTGGSRGIGAETVRLLAKEGYAVGINYRERGDAADALADEIRASGGTAVAVQGDVGEPADIERMFAEVDDSLGRLTALVNNAGMVGCDRVVADFEAEFLDRLMRVNVIGIMLCAREAVRRMSTRLGGQGGAIVNVSSMAATIGGRPRRTDYASSKRAVEGFTVGLAKEVGREGIRVNAVRPAVTLTDMVSDVTTNAELRAEVAKDFAMNRCADPIEIARPIAWLLSKEASYVSGAILDCSGGGFMLGRVLTTDGNTDSDS